MKKLKRNGDWVLCRGTRDEHFEMLADIIHGLLSALPNETKDSALALFIVRMIYDGLDISEAQANFIADNWSKAFDKAKEKFTNN